MARDYSARLNVAERELDSLREEAERLIDSDAAPGDIRNGLVDIAGRVDRLRMRIPVSDFDGEEISEGRELDNEALELSEWLNDQYGRFRMHSDRRALSAKKAPGAHSVYR